MKKKNNDFLIMIICGVIMVVTLVVSVLLVPKEEKVINNTNENDIGTMSGSSYLDDYDESDLIVENLPFIRLNYYDEETNERSGIMVTLDGNIYRYSFNEITVIYPDSDRFNVNQTIYFDNITEEEGSIAPEDLELLKVYTEGIEYEYDTEEAVFDTVGNSISYTDYNNENNVVLINSDGIKNTNPNTDFVLAILAEYGISL